MANLIAKLGLDSAEFKAGLNSAKAATGGFQGTIKSATNGLRNMFDAVLKPVAVVTAAVLALRKAFEFVNEIAAQAGNNLREIKTGNIQAGVETLENEINKLSNSFKRLEADQNAAAKSMDKGAESANKMAKAQQEIARAMELVADVRNTGGKNAEEINRRYDVGETQGATAQDVVKLNNAAKAAEAEYERKRNRSKEAAQQSREAAKKEAQALTEADRLRKQAVAIINKEPTEAEKKKRLEEPAIGLTWKDKEAKRKREAKEFDKTVFGGIKAAITGGSEEQKRIDDLSKAADAADAVSKKHHEQAKRLDEESINLQREYMEALQQKQDAEAQAAAIRVSLEAKTIAGVIALNDKALEKRREAAKEDWEMRLDVYQKNKELEEREASDKQAAEQRKAERIGAIRGRGLDADSMARVGGFLGGERPGLAVADKQLQVAKEQLDLAKETHKEQRAATGYLQRLVGGSSVDPLM